MRQKLIAIEVILTVSVFPIYQATENEGFLIVVLLLMGITGILIAFADKKQN